jgi:transcriptional regulator with XRE-family HTH domain
MLPTTVVRGRKNPLHLKFPARLRRIRKQRKLSASALSLLACMSRGSVGFLEVGTRLPRVNTVERLANALKVSPAWLAFGTEASFEPADGGELLCVGLAARVMDARVARGLGNKDMARRAEISAAEARAVQSGTMPTLDTIEQLAKALSVSSAWLAFGIGAMETTQRTKGQERLSASQPA